MYWIGHIRWQLQTRLGIILGWIVLENTKKLKIIKKRSIIGQENFKVDSLTKKSICYRFKQNYVITNLKCK